MSTAPATPRFILPPPHNWRQTAALSSAPDPVRQARHEFALLEAWLSSAQARELPLHQVECQQLPRGRAVERLLLQAHIQLRGNGDVGPALLVKQATREVLYTHRRVRARVIKTIFGSVEIARMAYSRADASSIYPLDEALELPARLFSYEPRKRAVKAAVQGPFQESIEAIAEITGVLVAKRSLEEVLLDAARDFDAFYRERTPEPDTGSILVAAVDGKGIPMVKPDGAQRTVRLAKGQKANRKRTATVAAVFTRAPWVRSPEEVVDSLFRTGSRPLTAEPCRGEPRGRGLGSASNLENPPRRGGSGRQGPSPDGHQAQTFRCQAQNAAGRG